MTMIYVPFDVDLCNAALLVLSPGDKNIPIEFQFPPKITSDNRKGSWDEPELRGIEPIAVFKTSGPREISLAWTYIVDGNRWTTDRIAKNVHAIRGYFALVRSGDVERSLAIRFQLWNLGGNPMSFRIKSIDVKHSDTIIAPCATFGPVVAGAITGVAGVPVQAGLVSASKAYPLRTDIVVELRLWTQGSTAAEGAKAKDIVQKLDLLAVTEDPKWY